MYGPGAGRRQQVLCNQNERCNKPDCTFHHLSPAANFVQPVGVQLKSGLCSYAANCRKVTCAFNHPSPALWSKGGDARPRTSVDALPAAVAASRTAAGRGGGGGVARGSNNAGSFTAGGVATGFAVGAGGRGSHNARGGFELLGPSGTAQGGRGAAAAVSLSSWTPHSNLHLGLVSDGGKTAPSFNVLPNIDNPLK